MIIITFGGVSAFVYSLFHLILLLCMIILCLVSLLLGTRQKNQGKYP